MRFLLRSCGMVLVLAATAAQADSIVFKTGQVLEGTVLKENDTTLELAVEYGTILVSRDKILRVESESISQKADREARQQEEREFLARMKSEGRVLHKGKWITEEEKRAVDEKLAEEKRKQDEAKKKAAEEAAKKKAEEQKKLAEQRKREEEARRENDEKSERAKRFEERKSGKERVDRNKSNQKSERTTTQDEWD